MKVTGELGYQCLTSVPINNSLAVSWLDEIRNLPRLSRFCRISKVTDLDCGHTRHHELIEILDPPAGYQWPALNLMEELGKLRSRTENGTYSSQYDLDLALFTLVASVHDGHMNTAPLTRAAIAFQRPVYLVSVSSDGVEDPLIYFYGAEQTMSQDR